MTDLVGPSLCMTLYFTCTFPSDRRAAQSKSCPNIQSLTNTISSSVKETIALLTFAEELRELFWHYLLALKKNRMCEEKEGCLSTNTRGGKVRVRKHEQRDRHKPSKIVKRLMNEKIIMSEGNCNVIECLVDYR